MKNLLRKQPKVQTNRSQDKTNRSQDKDKNEEKQGKDESPYYDDVSGPSFKDLTPKLYQNPPQDQNTKEQIAQSSSPNITLLQTQPFQPTMLQYKIDKLLQESSKRQQSYQNYIKKKLQQSYEMTQNYIKCLKQYKGELDKYVEQRNSKKQNKLQQYKANKVLSGQSKQARKYRKVKLSPFQPELNIPRAKQNGKISSKIDLKCKISLRFIVPLIQDYLKQRFPINLSFEIILPTRRKYLINNQKPDKILDVCIKTEQDQSQNIESLIRGYPFPLVPCGDRNGKIIEASQGPNTDFQFTILNQPQNIQLFSGGKVWVTILNRDSQMTYAYSSFSTEQLLYYSQQNSPHEAIPSSQTQIVEFYCPFTHLRNCIVHFKLENVPVYIEDNPNRVESNEPIELAKLSLHRQLYGDNQLTRESRLIQRINKFKTTSTSLLMRPDPHYLDKQPNKQELFARTNDKTLIMHRKMKQIEQINKYKEEHKSQYMEKIFDEALQKFSLQQIQLGCPKYLVFYYEKERSTPQKVFLRPQINLAKTQNAQSQQLIKQFQLRIVDKSVAKVLVQKGLVKLKQNASVDIQGNQKQGVYVFDNRVALILRVIIYPNRKLEEAIFGSDGRGMISHPNAENKKVKFDLSLKIQSQVGQLLSQQVYKLLPIRLKCEYELIFHNYEHQYQQVTIPLNFAQKPLDNSFQQNSQYNLLQKIKVIASQDIKYRISPMNDKLQLRVQFPKISSGSARSLPNDKRMIQVILLDSTSNYLLSAYRLTLLSYHKMRTIQKYTIGEICKFKMQLAMDEDVKGIMSEVGSYTSHANKNTKTRVGFYTSHVNECQVQCQGKNQLLIDDNRTYELEATFQTFSMQNPEDRVIIHMIDMDAGDVLKKWVVFVYYPQLLKIPKVLQQARSTIQLKVRRDKIFKYKYCLKNRMSKQRSFKFFSSNNSIISVPQFPIVLSQNQQSMIELQISVKRQDLTIQQQQKGLHVIVRIQDNLQKSGWNQLFKVFLD